MPSKSRPARGKVRAFVVQNTAHAPFWCVYFPCRTILIGAVRTSLRPLADALELILFREYVMANLNDLLKAARERGQAENLPYAGAITPQEAHALLQADSGAKLVDVRTNAERDWVGRVDIDPAQHAAIEWNTYPSGTQNPEFLTQLAQTADKDSVLLFLCRSGVRSRHAAKLATEQGYRNCFDILEGFEGGKDAAGHRKTVNGWCLAGLPWLGA